MSVQTSQEQFFSFLNGVLRRIYVSKAFWKKKRFGKEKLFSVIVTDMKYDILYVTRLWCLRRHIINDQKSQSSSYSVVRTIFMFTWAKWAS